MMSFVRTLSRKKVLAFYTDGVCKRQNNCDFFRFFAAWLVVFSHTFVIVEGTDKMAQEPFMMLTHGQIFSGQIGLFIFFALGGFLVTASYFRCRDVIKFIRNRCLRILPGFFCIILITVLIAGPLLSTYSVFEYFTQFETYRYLMNLSLLKWVDHLPGVFENNPAKGFINGSLWTIRAECYCYLSICLLGWLKLLNRRGVAILFLLVSALQMLFTAKLLPINTEAGMGFVLKTVTNLYLYFSLGMLFYLFREVIICDWKRIGFAAGLIVLPIWLPGLPEPLLAFAAAYLLFCIAYMPVLYVPNFAQDGDLSYGVYLYAWPLQQIICQWLGEKASWGTVFWISVPLIMGTAFLSWHLLEKKAMRLKT